MCLDVATSLFENLLCCLRHMNQFFKSSSRMYDSFYFKTVLLILSTAKIIHHVLKLSCLED